jgi:uncharacterized protein (DUF697 family)
VIDLSMTTTPSSKKQAEEITAQLVPGAGQLDAAGASRVLRFFLQRIAEVDRAKVVARVDELRQRYPDAAPDELAERLIKAKCQKTAAIGAVSSGGALLPGIGSLVAGAAGVVADLRATITLQAELVLEIAEVYGVPVDDADRQQVVMLLTGIGYGTSHLLTTTGSQLTGKLAARVARNWLTRALPIIGVATSASTNALSTYIVGQRAKAYFSRGPDAVGGWADTLRLITGVDERKVAGWLAERGVEARDTVGAAAMSASAALETVKALTWRSAAEAGDRLARSVRSASRTVGPAGGRASKKARRIRNVIGTASGSVKSAAGNTARRRRRNRNS